jgi:hypothetical protein
MSDVSTTVTPDVQSGSVVEAPTGIVAENQNTVQTNEVFRDFDEEHGNGTRPQITFGLSGRKIRCVNPVPTGQALQALRRALKKGQPDLTTTDMADILEGWVVSEDREAYNDALDELLDWTDVNRVMNYILEKSAGFPTPAS